MSFADLKGNYSGMGWDSGGLLGLIRVCCRTAALQPGLLAAAAQGLPLLSLELQHFVWDGVVALGQERVWEPPLGGVSRDRRVPAEGERSRADRLLRW